MIFGLGRNDLTIDAGTNSRIFNIEEAPNTFLNVEIRGMTLTGGSADDGGALRNTFGSVSLIDVALTNNTATSRGGVIYTDGDSGGGYGSTLATLFLDDVEVSGNTAPDGGGIFNNFDHVEVRNGSSVTGNTATGDGGGIYNTGDSVDLYRSRVDNNMASAANGVNTPDGLGGGIYSESNVFGYGSVYLNETTVSGNTAQAGTGVTGAPGVGYGGGLYVASGNVNFYASTVSGNRARRRADGAGEGEGGGLWSSAEYMDSYNSTFSGNSADDTGGGIYVGATGGASHNLTFTTVTANTAADGGGIYHDDTAAFTIQSSIVAGNTANDIFGSFTDTGNLIGGDPLLGPLQNNFGLTETHALLPGSPAIDASLSSRFEDQRGLRRFGTSDIGAYEVVLDFGDAPATFPTQLSNDGARHEVSGLYLGQSIDSEADGQPSALASDDDNFGFPDDEDGVTFVAAVGGFSGRVEVVSSGDGFLNAWIDADGSGTWDVSEQVITDVAVTAGVNVIDFNLLDAPNLTEFTAIARFRLDSAGGLAPTGAAADGEVEDYALLVERIYLPDGTTADGFVFTGITPPRVRTWCDPELALGYEYQVNPGGDNFTSVELVSGFGDDLYTLEFTDGDGVARTVIIGDFAPYDFEDPAQGNTPGGVSFFRITGIEPYAGLDPDDGAAFPSGIAFGDADNNGEAIINFTMTPLATAIASDDGYSVDEDNVLSSTDSVLDNDTDPNNDVLTAVLVTSTAHGTLVLNDDGTFVYTPNENYFGEDSFTYVANDGLGDSDPATVTITVNSVNDAPVAEDDSVTTDEDESVELDLLSLASDVEIDPLTVVIDTGPSHGQIVDNEGILTYVPDANFNGEDSFTYYVNDGELNSEIATVFIAVNAVNDAPVALDDDAETDENTPVTINVLANDSDVDSEVLTVDPQSDPSNGSIVVNADGTITYTPNAGFTGTDTFTYVANDGSIDSNEATVTVTVAPATGDEPTAELVPDPLNPARTALLVNGTSNNDVIQFQRLSRGRIRVRVNGENLGTFSSVDVVIANGLEGNDQIIVDGSLIVDARLFGNEGNDQLYAGLAGINLLDGGSGNDRLYASPFGSTVMVGGVDDDRLYGGFLSRDILIGGTGADDLYGGLLSESILIGGTTSFDRDPAALSLIQAEWNSNRSFSRRISTL